MPAPTALADFSPQVREAFDQACAESRRVFWFCPLSQHTISTCEPCCAGRAAHIGGTTTQVGTVGADDLTCTPGPDVISGLTGADVIVGLDGHDVICAGPGADQVYGGIGNDVIFGEPGNDRLFGQRGDDKLNGGPDRDYCDGGSQTGTGDTATACETVIEVP